MGLRWGVLASAVLLGAGCDGPIELHGAGGGGSGGSDAAALVQDAGITKGYHCAGNDQRIARRDVCNGVADCPMGDDEVCQVPVCPAHEETVAAFLGNASVCSVHDIGDTSLDLHYNARCSETESVHWSDRCDGVVECSNGEDEMDCPLLCDAHGCLFPCADGSLIPQAAVCDGEVDCPDSDDEPCQDKFPCADGSVVSLNVLCDGVSDCPDVTDEATCPRPDVFICDDGEQILFPYTNHGCFGPPPLCRDGSDIGPVCLD